MTIVKKIVYGITGEDIEFDTLEQAFKYVFEHYPEKFFNKDSYIRLCEALIWEDEKLVVDRN